MPILYRRGSSQYYTVEPRKGTGEGKTLILIHTNLTDHRIYDAMLPFLDDAFQIVRYDLRGFGRSELGSGALSLDLYVEDLKYLITELRLSAVHLIGFGFGALVALKLSTVYPELTDHLVLMTMACFPEESYASVKAHRRKITENRSKIPVDTLIHKVTSLSTGDPQFERIKQMMNRVPVPTYLKIMELTLYTNPIPYLHKTTKPVLILGAEREVVFPQNLLSLTASVLANIKYTVVPNSSSFMLIDQPEMTANLINQFLKIGKPPLYTKDELTNDIYESVRRYTMHSYKENVKHELVRNQIRVDFLHSFRVEINDRQVVQGWNQRYAQQILLYLLFHERVTRDQLCEQLWPETPIHISRRNLRVYLYYLKKLLNTGTPDDPVLIIDREHLYLNGDVTSDTLSFISQVNLALREEDEQVKLELVKNLLDQIENADFLKILYDDWFLQIRGQLEEDLISLTIWMGRKLLEKGEHQTANRHLQKAVAVFEENEEIIWILKNGKGRMSS